MFELTAPNAFIPYPFLWDPKRLRFAACRREGIFLVDLETSATEDLLAKQGAPLAFSPSGDAIALLAQDGMDLVVYVLEIPGGRVLWESPVGRGIDDLQWSPDGRRVAWLGDECKVRDARSGAFIYEHRRTEDLRTARLDAMRHDERVEFKYSERVEFNAQQIVPEEVVWAPNSEFIAVRFDEDVVVLRAEVGEQIAQVPLDRNDHLSWSQWGEALFESNGVRLARRAPPRGETGKCCFSADSRFVAAEGRWPNLIIETEREHLVLQPPVLSEQRANLSWFAWSAQGTLAIAYDDRSVCLWRADDGISELARFGSRGSASWAYSGSFSHDGRFLAVHERLPGGETKLNVVDVR